MLLVESLLGSSSAEPAYIEDVFSTYLYTGNGSTQTITNGIDLSGKGGLVWCKSRSTVSYDHLLFDTVRGVNKSLNTTLTSGEQTTASSLTAFNSTGFSLGSAAFVNGTGGGNFVGWSFRKQAKFFDVVTYTGNGTNGRSVPHSLGSVPGMIIVKRTDTTGAWCVYHRSAGGDLFLNTTAAQTGTLTNITFATSTTFDVGVSSGSNANASGGTYVAYLFAHNAGGFDVTGTSNVITCDSVSVTNGVYTFVDIGYEPQLIIWKSASGTSDWRMVDNMRGFTTFPDRGAVLSANLSSAELAGDSPVFPTATGFRVNNNLTTGTYIYIAIRRGPMKTPTSGTSVFSPIASSDATGTKLTTSFPVDSQIFGLRGGTTNKNNVYDRLRGVSSTTTESGARLITSSTGAETAAGNETRLWDNTGFQMPSTFGGASTVFWNFRRAPGFFDQVCYTGTGSATTFNHNLGIAPELMIVKRRSATSTWRVYSNALTSAAYALTLNSTAAEASLPTVWNSTAPTSSVFSVGTSTDTNASSGTYVAYLFGTVAGVSKVGSYTGTGTTLQVNCGFTSGARFVLIKRKDSTGDWYLWDSARGIVAGNDPYLLLNSTAAEVTSTDYIDTYSAGFEISSTAPAAINASGGTFIFLAIA